MSNIWLITKREYWTRVKNKAFLLTTFLTPLGILLFIAVAGFIFSQGSDDRKEIYVLDHANLLEGELTSRDNLQFKFTQKSLDTLLAEYGRQETDGILELNSFDPNSTAKYEAILHADKALAIDETFSVENAIRKKIRNYKLKTLNIADSTINKLNTSVALSLIHI